MPEPVDQVSERVHATAGGLRRLVADAEATWRSRAPSDAQHDGTLTDDGSDPDHAGAAGAVPRWRPFEDAFPTFYQFTNRPRA